VKITLKEIAKKIGGEIVGRPDIVITGISGIKEAKKGDITFLANPKYDILVSATKASAIITSKDSKNGKSFLGVCKGSKFIFQRGAKTPHGYP
jgi:UDP-3-O-[3-hydroxymyristoyl] glucosamine N-acyltransferase